jgi:hypothetical protein
LPGRTAWWRVMRPFSNGYGTPVGGSRLAALFALLLSAVVRLTTTVRHPVARRNTTGCLPVARSPSRFEVGLLSAGCQPRWAGVVRDGPSRAEREDQNPFDDDHFRCKFA